MNKQIIADHVSAACMLLHTDEHALQKSQAAVDQIRKSRSVLGQLLSDEQRAALLAQCTSIQDKVQKHALFALAAPDLELHDVK